MLTRFRIMAHATAIALTLGAAQFVTPAALAEDVAMTPENKAAIETIIRDYILANPEIIQEAQQALEAKQAEAQRVAQKETIENASKDIFNASHDAIVGNPNGNVTVVEFYDYNCGFCKRALSDMDAMIKADPNLRFVLKEFPILGEDSQRAHIVAQAFMRLMPEKYAEFHRTLLTGKGRADEARAVELAVSLGADETKLREAMKDPAIIEGFRTTFQLADQLAITGTPSYVIGDEVVFGALGADTLTKKVTNMRACKSTQC